MAAFLSHSPRIVFQDKSLLIISKPFGWVVNRVQSVRGFTVQDWVEENFKFQISDCGPSSDFVNRSGIVHRLDKDTSGLLIIAKTPQAFQNLQKQFKDRKVKKTYLALVHGKVEPGKGTISVPVGRQALNRRRFGVIAGGRKAVTQYQVMKHFASSKVNHLRSGNKVEKPGLQIFSQLPLSSNDNLSVVKGQVPNTSQYTFLVLYPRTGRTHQIRVHLKYIGHPIVADPLYLGKKTLKKDKQWCPRLFLHAHRLQFAHPQTGETVQFSVDLPKELQEIINHGQLDTEKL